MPKPREYLARGLAAFASISGSVALLMAVAAYEPAILTRLVGNVAGSLVVVGGTIVSVMAWSRVCYDTTYRFFRGRV